jgi:replicative DNA helicase
MEEKKTKTEDSTQRGLPPQNIAAEMSLLGCLMIDKSAIVKVVDFLEPLDFYRKAHQDIYKACQELFDKGEAIDILTVSNRLKEKKQFDEIGTGYLTDLINSIPTAANVVSYATVIRQKRMLRDLYSAAADIASIANSDIEDPEVLLDQSEQRIFDIAQKGLSKNFLPVKVSLEEAFERIEKLSRQKEGLRGLATGFTELDNKLSGLQKSDLIILASRPSLGKSALALNIADNVAVNYKKHVAIFSLEMSRDQLVDRLITDQSGVDMWKMRTGKTLTDEDFAQIRNALDILSKAPLYINDSASLNVLQIRAMARRMQAKEGLDLIVVDYLQLMEPRNAQVSIVQQMTEISRSLKSLARELNVPVLALSQLSRSIEHRTPPTPRLSDLRETGAIEQDADVVLFIHREDRYQEDSPKKNIAEIIIAKHRNGPVGQVELYFDESRVSFRNLEKEEYQEE